MKHFLLLIILIQLTFTLSLKASHIVGGEFELVHVDGTTYELKLIQYFDDVNGEPGAEDMFADVYIYSKRNNNFMQSVRLYNVGYEYVPYTNPECSDSRLITRRIVYTTEIQLSASIYNEEEGYYAVYERCCRNYTISNLNNPDLTGQTFYLEFPPVVKDDQPFLNSSPILFPPLSDYACVNELYYFDFRGTDTDGDSLSYRMSVPLNSTQSNIPVALPTPSPAPHPLVNFSDGVTADNMVSGTPNLSINKDGFLTVRPDRLGLFVFAITVDEFRDGLKIGSVKRDFQMLVIDCEISTPPSTTAIIQGDPVIYEDSPPVITYSVDENKCIQFQVTDPDPAEKITIKAKAVNFDADLSDIFPDQTQVLYGNSDTLKFDICLPNCPLTSGEPAIIDFLVMDDACSLPLIDTMRMTFALEDDGNESPYIIDNKNILPITLNAGESFELVVKGQDDNGDFLSLEAVPVDDNFRLRDYDMSFPTLEAGPGGITKIFRWTADCEKYNLAENNDLSLYFLLEEDRFCNNGPGDSLRLDIHVNLPENHPPVVSTDGLASTDVTVVLGETLKFTVIGDDIDNDFMSLEAVGNGFTLSDVNVNFQNTSGMGRIGSIFTWNVNCDNVDLTLQDNFEFLFIATDQGNCNTSNADTLKINVHVEPDINTQPLMTVNGPVEPIGENEFTAEAVVGSRFFFRVQATDEDNDLLLLRLDKVIYGDQEIDRNLLNFNFFGAQGIGRVSSQFYWMPECIYLGNDYQDNEFRLIFTAVDNNCLEAKSDTIAVTVIVTDSPVGFEEYVPPNVFTPNEDEWNGYFELPNLPDGNCANRFETVEIYNRWGKLVFNSQEKNFRWDGEDAPPGLYYYHLKYGDFIYKGTVSILK